MSIASSSPSSSVNPLSPMLAGCRRTLRHVWRRLTWSPPPGPIFHITHYKAGSQWVRRVLEELAEPWVVRPELESTQFRSRFIQPRGVYPTVYVTREQFESVKLSVGWKRFIVIRDPRDTLISLYFSLKTSHDMENRDMSDCRARLQGMATERALITLIRVGFESVSSIQRSWLEGPDELLKYEDVLDRDTELFERVLVGQCGLKTTPERLRAVVTANRFEARSGRKPGQEDRTSHERKGIAGDWRN